MLSVFCYRLKSVYLRVKTLSPGCLIDCWFANQVLVVLLFTPFFVGLQRVFCTVLTSDFVIPHELT